MCGLLITSAQRVKLSGVPPGCKCAFPDEKRSWWNGAEPCALHIHDPADIGQSVLIQVTPERFVTAAERQYLTR